MTPKAKNDSRPPSPARPRTLPGRAPASNACPLFFRVLVYEARSGEKSFTDCGYELGRQIFSIVGNELGEDVLGELVVLIMKRDTLAILQWLKSRVPRMMDMIPTREYRAFMKGFMQAVVE
ncbi:MULTISPECIES: hypothetical protein [Polyangium]|uniref:Uncharacterized protein n=2 Tax=Polyangium TaxID=55 RepID=A0A4U1IWQ9_9BACT|nr:MULTISPECIES: hypothetical protein [Polyangium]MDI1428745.1 hypothetical protein [Polyangium sorediatum]TKC99003.1 hypothetical protein E8A74_39260 [Polyangium fumosum]